MIRRLRALTYGPHGGQNLGDELLLSCIAAQLAEVGVDVTASSQDPAATVSAHGIPAVPMANVKGWHLSPLRRVREFDLVVVAGGEQIAGGRYRNPLRGHIANLFAVAIASRRASLPLLIVGVGAEEIRGGISRGYLRYVLASASYVSCRERRSAQYLSRFSRQPIALSVDPAFGLERLHEAERVAARAQLEAKLGRPGPYLLFCPAEDRRRDVSYAHTVAVALRDVARRTGGVVLVKAMDHQPGYDSSITEDPVFTGPEFEVLPAEPFDRDELIKIFAAVDHVTSARMHPLIIAMTQGTPWLCLHRNEKLRRFSDLVAVPGIEVDDLDPSGMAETVVRQLKQQGPSPAVETRLHELRLQFDASTRGLARAIRAIP